MNIRSISDELKIDENSFIQSKIQNIISAGYKFVSCYWSNHRTSGKKLEHDYAAKFSSLSLGLSFILIPWFFVE